MAETTGISWTNHTFNMAWGCHEVSPGCDNCYARTVAKRWGHNVWGPPKDTDRRLFGESHWAEPLKWNRDAERAGERRRVFCSSMADVFEAHPLYDGEGGEREMLWTLIRETPWLDWQILTKRPERIARHLPADWGKGYPNVWLGTSIENQDYTRRARTLVLVPAPVHFLSLEPLLGPVDLTACIVDEDSTADVTTAIDWVIVGGESGPRHRPMEIEWLEDLRAQCDFAGIPMWVKQDSGRSPGLQGRIPDDLWVQQFPTTAYREGV